jgi:hypothetical protein
MADGTTETTGPGVDRPASTGAQGGPPTTPRSDAVPTAPPNVHRRRRFLPVLVLAALVLVGCALAMVALIDGDGSLHRSFDDALLDERYSADLTRGRGDFTVVDDGASASSYAADGYHLVAREATPAWRGVQTNGTHTSLGVEVSVRAVAPDGDFAFGPFCFASPQRAHGLLVTTDGRALLVETANSGPGALRVVRSRPIAELDWSRWHDLRIDCTVRALTGSGPVALRGSIDGRVVVRATSGLRSDAFAYTGFGGVNEASAPAEWVVRTFARLGADDVGSNP